MPLVTGEHLGYVHMPKTAGTYTAQVLERAGLASHQGLNNWRSHMSAQDGREHLEGRYVLGGIRDPWSWYCSWIAHHRERGTGEPGSCLAVQARAVGSDTDSLAGALAAPELHAVLPTDARPWLPVQADGDYIRECIEWGVGLYTWMFLRSYVPREIRQLVVRGSVSLKDAILIDAFIGAHAPGQGLVAAVCWSRRLDSKALAELATAAAFVDPVNVANVHHDPAQHWSGDALVELSSSTFDLIGLTDRLVVDAFHFGASSNQCAWTREGLDT